MKGTGHSQSIQSVINSIIDIFSGQQLKNGLGSSSLGSFSSQLPLGAVYDSYRLYIVVDIVDNDNGVTTYQIPSAVVVEPDMSLLSLISQQLSNPNAMNSLSSILNSGNSQLTTQTVLAISSLLNSVSLSDQLAMASMGNLSIILMNLKTYFKT